MATIKWKKIGDPEILAQGYGKKFVKQKFLDHKNQEADFFFTDPGEWAIVLAITQDKKVIMTRQYKQGTDDIVDELPAGAVEKSDKNPEETIKRELMEETGYEAKEVIQLGFTWENSRNSRCRGYYFLAQDCKKVKGQKLDDGEQLETYELELKDFFDKIIKTEFINADLYLITLRALKYLGLKAVIE